MFGKRKSKEQPSLGGATAPRFEAAQGAGRLGTVIVPRSALTQATQGGNPYDLVQAVINFVNGMTGEGLYSRFELVQQAMQAFHADFYLAQVNNGGHSQFIHNSFGNLSYVITDVRAGLSAMKAQAHLGIFERMAAWVDANPDEVKKQTGFDGGRAPMLDELDKLFYAADNAQPMIAQSARWIASWPELRPVDDGDYAEAMRRVVLLNPLREARLVTRSVENLRTQMIDPFHVSVGLACSNAPKIEFKMGIGGGSMMEIDGEQQMTWLVRTNAGNRFCVVTKKHAALYEYLEADNPPMPAMGDSEGMKQAIQDGRLARYKPPTVGARLSLIQSELVGGVIELAVEFGAPIALDLLLRKAEIETRGAAVSPLMVEPKSTGPVVNWIVDAGGQALFLMTLGNGSALLRPSDNRQLALVSKAEILAHAKQVEAGAIKAPT